MKKNIVVFLLIFYTTFSLAQETVQWRGDNRDGKYNETNLLKDWPENGPELFWHFDDLGEGHSSAAVTTNFIYTTGASGVIGYVFAFNHTGELKWKYDYGKEWMESYNGSRTTPLVIGDKLYIMSGYGVITCMNSSNGNVIWTVDTHKKYNGRNIVWGVTENLAYDGDKIFCIVGGIENNVVALNKNTGKLIWKSEGVKELSAYNSPLVIVHNERKILVAQTANSILGLDVNNGELLWSHPQPNQYSVHANTPLYKDGMLYCISGYGKGGVMLKISDDGNAITELWRNSTLDSRMGGVVLLNDIIYGAGDYSRKWIGLDWKTGVVLFSSTMMGKGNLIFADDMLYCYSESGEVGLVKPGSSSFDLVNKFRVPYGSAQHWAHLVIHDKRLYIRHGNSLMAYNISNYNDSINLKSN